MGRFSRASEERLEQLHPDLQRLLREAIKVIDFTVVETHRSVERQQELYAQGRTAPGPIVTHIDGVRRKGKHNYRPALAADLVPYNATAGSADWRDREKFSVLGGVLLGLAHAMGIRARWGGNWDADDQFNESGDAWDMPHIELVDG